MVQVEKGEKGVEVDDEKVRFWARTTSLKSLEILKACKVVVETFGILNEKEPRKLKNSNLEENFERKFGVWKIVHGRFLNLKEKGQTKSAKENGLMDFCLSKGLLRPKESWEEELERIIKVKEMKTKEIYERMKAAKSKKKKIELLKECKETLDTGIRNPKLSIENLELQAYAKIKTNISIVTKPNPADKPVKTTALDKIEDDLIISPRLPRKKTTSTSSPRKMTSTRKMTGKMTMKAKNSPLATSVARKLGLVSLPSVRKIAEGLQCTHPPSAHNGAISTVRKPVLTSSSEVVRKTDCTLVHWAGQPMGGERDEKTEAWAATQPIRAKEMKETC